MRFEGSIKAWYDDRGFGFIAPDQGGQEIFVHVNSFDARFGRPQIGRRVSFEVELNREGKKRAKKVDALRERRVRPVRRGGGPAPWGTASLFALPLFATGFVLAAIFWRVPAWIALLYAVASVVCFIAYAMDKSAAQSGGWRTSEQTLLLLGLVGGWPGAILAQQLFRHKSSKASFRSAFWGTVVLNVAAFLTLTSPMGRQLLGR